MIRIDILAVGAMVQDGVHALDDPFAADGVVARAFCAILLIPKKWKISNLPPVKRAAT